MMTEEELLRDPRVAGLSYISGRYVPEEDDALAELVEDHLRHLLAGHVTRTGCAKSIVRALSSYVHLVFQRENRIALQGLRDDIRRGNEHAEAYRALMRPDIPTPSGAQERIRAIVEKHFDDVRYYSDSFDLQHRWATEAMGAIRQILREPASGAQADEWARLVERIIVYLLNELCLSEQSAEHHAEALALLSAPAETGEPAAWLCRVLDNPDHPPTLLHREPQSPLPANWEAVPLYRRAERAEPAGAGKMLDDIERIIEGQLRGEEATFHGGALEAIRQIRRALGGS